MNTRNSQWMFSQLHGTAGQVRFILVSPSMSILLLLDEQASLLFHGKNTYVFATLSLQMILLQEERFGRHVAA